MSLKETCTTILGLPPHTADGEVEAALLNLLKNLPISASSGATGSLSVDSVPSPACAGLSIQANPRNPRELLAKLSADYASKHNVSFAVAYGIVSAEISRATM